MNKLVLILSVFVAQAQSNAASDDQALFRAHVFTRAIDGYSAVIDRQIQTVYRDAVANAGSADQIQTARLAMMQLRRQQLNAYLGQRLPYYGRLRGKVLASGEISEIAVNKDGKWMTVLATGAGGRRFEYDYNSALSDIAAKHCVTQGCVFKVQRIAESLFARTRSFESTVKFADRRYNFNVKLVTSGDRFKASMADAADQTAYELGPWMVIGTPVALAMHLVLAPAFIEKGTYAVRREAIRAEYRKIALAKPVLGG